MVETVPVAARRELGELLEPLDRQVASTWRLTSRRVGRSDRGDRRQGIPAFHFVGPEAEHEPLRLGIFAGLHGDEPAGAAAVAQFIEALVLQPTRAKGYDLWFYPICNPTGYEDGTRFNRAGADLNREFWRNSLHWEIQSLEEELRARQFQGIITLHEDDTSEGIYGYAHGRVINESLLEPALRAAEATLPRDARDMIDGFPAVGGVLKQCFTGILAAPPEQSPQPFDIIFETPGRAPFDAQVNAAEAALQSVLKEYRTFLAYAGNL